MMGLLDGTKADEHQVSNPETLHPESLVSNPETLHPASSNPGTLYPKSYILNPKPGILQRSLYLFLALSLSL